MTTAANQNLIVSRIKVYKQVMILACDGNCEKAWGIKNRPRIQFDQNDADDFAWFADSELASAPSNPGTEEGGDCKPCHRIHNKWCFLECERSDSRPVGKFRSIQLPDFTRRIYNQPSKHPVQ